MKTNARIRSLLAAILLGALAFQGSAVPCSADVTLYATSPATNKIYSVDINTNTVTPVINDAHGSDSLLFAPNGDIVYSGSNNGTVRLFNPKTNQDTSLGGGLTSVGDLALEPSMTSVVVADTLGGAIWRANLSGGVSLLKSYGVFVRGLAYDGKGNLWANMGDNSINQINPTTGAILLSIPTPGGDGLTYDSFTGKLYFAGEGVSTNPTYSFDPNTMTVTPLPNSGIFTPDGLTSDGKGNLYIASYGDQHVYQYNLSTDQLTQRTFVPGLDDLAPLSGLGSSVPEPGSVALLCGVLTLGGLTLRRRKK